MTRTKKVGPAGSLGPRYGTVARRRYAEIVTQLRAPHECPSCHVRAVRRLSVGVWLCGKCGIKFTGGAYTPTTKLGEIARRASRGGAPPGAVMREPEAPQTAARPPSEASRRRLRKKPGEKTAEPEVG